MKQRSLFLSFLLVLAAAVAAAALLASGQISSTPFSEEETDIGLYLEDDSILTSDKEAVQISGTTATLLRGGHYELSGFLSDGQIIVSAGPEDEVTLELDDVSITCSDSAPIWIKSAGKVKIRLPEDTVNFLADGEFYSLSPDGEAPNACISSRADLDIKGKGSLTVTASYHNGISSSDDLEIKSGILTVTAPDHALRGKDSVEITDGLIRLSAGACAIKSAGAVTVSGGSIQADAGRHIIQSVTAITVTEQSSLSADCSGPPAACDGEISLAYSLTDKS